MQKSGPGAPPGVDEWPNPQSFKYIYIYIYGVGCFIPMFWTCLDLLYPCTNVRNIRMYMGLVVGLVYGLVVVPLPRPPQTPHRSRNNLNIRSLGLTTPLSNNTWSMIHSPMNTK